MEKFRIGNDLAICWAIIGDDGRPFPLADKTVRVFLTHPRGRTEITADISVQDNVIVWNFAAIKQRYLGTYKLTVEIYSPLHIRVTKRDINEAFALVSDSFYEDIESGKPDINESGELRLSTTLEVVRIFPVIPEIGDNENWWEEGVDTGKPSRGPQGEKGDKGDKGDQGEQGIQGPKGEIAYFDFQVEKDMKLYLTTITTDNAEVLDFNVNDDGYLTVDMK